MADEQGAQGSDGNVSQGQAQHIPYARFQEVLTARNDLAAQLKASQEALTALKAQHEQATKTLTERENAIKQAQLQAARYKVASAKGIPVTLADRLVGDNEDALIADADALAQLLKVAAPAAPGVPPTKSGSPPPALDLSKMSPEEIRKARAEGKIKMT